VEAEVSHWGRRSRRAEKGAGAFTTPFAALGCPVGGSLVPRIDSLPHLSSAGQSGRPDSPHVASPGATPQATTHDPLDEGV